MAAINPIVSARRVTDNLDTLYQSYQKDARKLLEGTNNGSRLAGWLLGKDPVMSDSMHQNFYNNVQQRVSVLEPLLEQAHAIDPVETARIANDAVAILVRPMPGEKNTLEWAAAVIEIYSMPLLKWMDQASLSDLRERYLVACPEKFLLPKQQELLDEMEHCLGMKQKKRKGSFFFLK